MKIIKINLNKIKKEQIDTIVDYLKRGKIIAYPTDTIYGLGCDATNKKAINKIYKIKNRDKKFPLLILVGSFCMLRKYCYLNKKQYEFIKNIRNNSRKPTSVILKSRGILPPELTGGLDSIAVRLPADLPKSDFLIRIIRGVNKPVVSTSLNISGQKPISNIYNIKKHFNQSKLDLVVDTGAVRRVKPSRVVDLREAGKIKVVRK